MPAPHENRLWSPLSLLWLAVSSLLLGKGTQYLWQGMEQGAWLHAGWGQLLILSLIALPVLRQKQRVVLVYMAALSALLLGLAVEVFVEKGHQVHNLIEHALQYGSPLLLGLVLWGQWTPKRTRRFARILVALTFIGHGVYAVGYQQDSTNFMEMTRSLLPLDAREARTFLMAAGILDLLAAACLLAGRGLRVALIYMTGWGLLTALVRAYIYYDSTVPASVGPAFWETAFRLCHGLVPLWFFLSPDPKMKTRKTP